MHEFEYSASDVNNEKQTVVVYRCFTPEQISINFQWLVIIINFNDFRQESSKTLHTIGKSMLLSSGEAVASSLHRFLSCETLYSFISTPSSHLFVSICGSFSKQDQYQLILLFSRRSLSHFCRLLHRVNQVKCVSVLI